ncbi:MAG: iron uptake porin, partial [Phormidesmis sp. CAN_BIN44]|nr:iron uptake porin [Phormidesmis sp. CAN_BIN44]
MNKKQVSLTQKISLTYLLAGAIFLVESPVFASETENSSSFKVAELSSQNRSDALDRVSSLSEIDQVTSVSQLSDVRPTDWAFQALQSLVERYGCIVGYPDKTFRGNRALTRYEFAAGLNACLDRVNELIAAATADLVKKEDLATLQKLQEEFAAELATVRGRVDALEARTTTLEKQQFSTTTKLSGEVIFSLASAYGAYPGLGNRRSLASGTTTGGAPGRDANVVFNNRVRLKLLTSFS